MNKSKLFWSVSLICTLATSFSLMAAGSPSKNTDIKDSFAYSGELNPAEVMSAEYQRLSLSGTDATVSFKVMVPVMEEGMLLVKDAEGLPLHNEVNPDPDSAAIAIPFSVTQFVRAGVFDQVSFEAAVDDTLQKLKQVSAFGPRNDTTATEASMPITRDPGSACGGYPQGITVTVKTEKAGSGVRSEDFECTEGRGNSDSDWYLTSSQWSSPAAAD